MKSVILERAETTMPRRDLRLGHTSGFRSFPGLNSPFAQHRFRSVSSSV